jgi:hypothetical protein
MADDLTEELKKLEKDIGKVKESNWMDEHKLKMIGEGFGWLRRTYRKRWQESPCMMGRWMTVSPEMQELDGQLMDGVRIGEFCDSTGQGGKC